MQEKTKETAEKITKRATSKKAETSSKKATTENVLSKKAASKTSTKKATTKTTSAKTSKRKTTSKATATKSSAKKTTTKKTATARKTAVKKTTTKRTTSKVAKKPELVEYYDLPYRYNETVVRILAQTPTTLFVYWDISDKDREKYVETYGENFFANTTPVLIVHNKTMNYSFEIEINDFANSWYFTVFDSKCDYEIELGRRAKPMQIQLPNNYLYITSSNTIEAPNDHILFEKKQENVFFKNVKTNERISRNVASFEFMRYVGRIYNIYDLYKKIYKNEELENLEKNPSSSF